MLSNIKVLIWDFDGTFYRPDPELFAKVREAELHVIRDHTGWSEEKTEVEFYKKYKKVIESATAVAAYLSGITIAEAAVEMEKYFDRRDFLSRDEKLIATFETLKHFRHFTLANGVIARYKETLVTLGVPVSMFEEIVTSETVGVTKPDEKGFLYIMKKTGLPPSEHLMIGDREAVDLVPAKALGMKTCLVWSDQKSAVANITIPSIYDLAKAILVP